MSIEQILGNVRAQVVSPNDVVLITSDRYLTGQQLQVVGQHFQKRLPNTKVVMLMKGMTAEVNKGAHQVPLSIPTL